MPACMGPEGFRRKTTMDVRYRDVDLMGHVNNAVYFTYLEQARIDYFRDLFAAYPALARPPGFIVASARIDYRAPIVEDERLDVWIRVSEIGRSSFKMAHEIRRLARDEVAATGETIQLTYDYKAAQAVPLSSELCAAFEDFEGRPIPRKAAR